MKEHNKLVRDRIPEIIAKEGRPCKYSVLSDKEFLEYLDKKLHEEMIEYLENGEIEELVDLEEVLRAIIKAKGLEYAEFEQRRIDKAIARGAFDSKILLIQSD